MNGLKRDLIGIAVVVIVAVGINVAEASDLIGLFRDLQGTENCMQESLNQVHDIYLILKEPSSEGGVAGWQASLSATPGIYIVSASFSGSAVNFGSDNDYIIGLGSPLNSGDIVILANFSVFVTNPGGITLEPLQNGGLGSPAYLAADDELSIVLANVEYGRGILPSVSFDVACPESNLAGAVPVSNQSWSSLKAVYR